MVSDFCCAHLSGKETYGSLQFRCWDVLVTAQGGDSIVSVHYQRNNLFKKLQLNHSKKTCRRFTILAHPNKTNAKFTQHLTHGLKN